MQTEAYCNAVASMQTIFRACRGAEAQTDRMLKVLLNVIDGSRCRETALDFVATHRVAQGFAIDEGAIKANLDDIEMTLLPALLQPIVGQA